MWNLQGELHYFPSPSPNNFPQSSAGMYVILDGVAHGI